MPAPGAFVNPLNPFKSIAGSTWEKGAGATGPSKYAIPRIGQGATVSLGPTNHPYMPNNTQDPNGRMYRATIGQPMGGSGGYGGGGGGSPSMGVNPYQSMARIGNAPGTMSAPSPTAGGGGASGLGSLYNMQRPGNGPLDGMNDAASLDHYFANAPTSAYNNARAYFPQAFAGQGSGGTSTVPAGNGQGTTFDPNTGQWVPSQGGVTSGPTYQQSTIGNDSPLAPRHAYDYSPSQSSDGRVQFNPAAMLNGDFGSFPSSGDPRELLHGRPWTGFGGGGGVPPVVGGATGEQYPPSMARKDGGSVYQPKPYMVGEKGPEAYIPKSGAGMQLIGLDGPEIRHFPEDGKIIPNNKLGNYLTPRAYGGRVSGAAQPTLTPYTQMPYGGRPYYPPGFNPAAASFLPQFMPQAPQMSPEEQQFANDPNAPDSPWAMARFIRMGLQANARRKLAVDAAQQSLAASHAQSVAQAGADVGPPSFLQQGYGGDPTRNFAYTVTGADGRPVQPHGQFQSLDISGNPVQGPLGGYYPMGPQQGGDPNMDRSQVTWTQANQMQQLQHPQARVSPLAALVGG